MPVITGSAGDDTLYGGGPDTLVGLAGNDSYIVYSGADTIVEQEGEGTDTVFTFASYVLGAGISVETLSAAIHGATDRIDLTGNALAQRLIGNYGDNILNGGGGSDTLMGLAGNDTYRVQGAELVIEAVGQGFDTVIASQSYSLSADASVEALALDALAGNANLLGNGFAQTLTGNAGANTLNGNGGGDTLIGGAGNDTYVVYSNADRVIEVDNATDDQDTVLTFGSYTLGNGVSVETLSAAVHAGTDPLVLVGNGLTQHIIGNYGDNILNGFQATSGEGDTLQGLAGNDIYRVYSDRDVVIEAAGQGTDEVYTSGNYRLGAGQSVEVLSAADQGIAYALTLVGNELAQKIIGDYGDNLIVSGGGADTLIGLRGDDIFRIGSAPFPTVEARPEIVTIADYGTGADVIALDPRIFTGIALGALNPAQIVMGSAAADADDRILYNAQTGALFYDADGTGATAAVQIAVLPTGLSASQLLIRGDAPYTVTIPEVRVTEGGDTGTTSITFTVQLDHAANSDFRFNYSNAAGSEVIPTNETRFGSFTIAAGQSSGTFTVQVANNDYVTFDQILSMSVRSLELNENFIDSYTARAILVDDDRTHSFSASGTYLTGGATGTGTSLNALPANSGVGISAPDFRLVFGPDSLAEGHNQFVLGNGNGVLDFSQFGMGISYFGNGVLGMTPDGRILVHNAFVPQSDGVRRGTLIGSELADDLDFVEGDNIPATIDGGGGNDTMRGFKGSHVIGGAGDDWIDTIAFGATMTGGTGADIFRIFDWTTTVSGENSPNIITDFVPGEDRIHLRHTPLQDPGVLPPGQLTAAQFGIGATATTADQRILYNPDTGELLLTTNGSANGGLEAVFAILPTHLSLTAESFTVVTV